MVLNYKLYAIRHKLFMVFYRKYRPQTFADLIGQTPIKEALAQALGKNAGGHAYLFCGPRGCGKTSTARIFAKAINCEARGTEQVAGSKKSRVTSHELRTIDVEPCNECASCTAITNGFHLDVIEIDAASNRGIDDIRELRERIKLSPTSGKKKVYIIDEVHMLTTEAFNALLKTLEEPPEHAIIVMATTEPHKLPQTILSRCQRYNFSLATAEELVTALQTIIDKEQVEIADDALQVLVQRAEGSFRDAVKLLDQIATVGKPITLATVLDFFQAPQATQATTFCDLLFANDEHAILTYLQTMQRNGDNAREFLGVLMKYIRDMLLLKANLGETYVQDAYAPEHYKAMLAQAKHINKPSLLVLLKLLVQAQKDSKITPIPQLPLELAALEFISRTGSVADTNAPVVEKDTPKVVAPFVQTMPVATPAIPEAEAIVPEEAGAMLAERSDSIVMASKKESRATIANVMQTTRAHPERSDSAMPVAGATIEEKWSAFIERCLEKNHAIALLLKNATVKQFDGKKLTLEVFYKFHKERLESEKIRRIAENNLYEVFGEPVVLSCILAKDVKPKRIMTNDLAKDALQVFGIQDEIS